MAGSAHEVIRETRREQDGVHGPAPEEPPAGSQSVRSSDEAGNDRGAKGRRKVEVRRTDGRKRPPTPVPARARQRWNQPSAIGLDDIERVTGGLGDEAKSRSLSNRAPTDWKAGCGRSACPVWREGERMRPLPLPYPLLPMLLALKASNRISSKPEDESLNSHRQRGAACAVSLRGFTRPARRDERQ